MRSKPVWAGVAGATALRRQPPRGRARAPVPDLGQALTAVLPRAAGSGQRGGHEELRWRGGSRLLVPWQGLCARRSGGGSSTAPKGGWAHPPAAAAPAAPVPGPAPAHLLPLRQPRDPCVLHGTPHHVRGRPHLPQTGVVYLRGCAAGGSRCRPGRLAAKVGRWQAHRRREPHHCGARLLAAGIPGSSLRAQWQLRGGSH